MSSQHDLSSGERRAIHGLFIYMAIPMAAFALFIIVAIYANAKRGNLENLGLIVFIIVCFIGGLAAMIGCDPDE